MKLEFDGIIVVKAHFKSNQNKLLFHYLWINYLLNGKKIQYLHGIAIVESFGSGLYSSFGK